CIAGSYQGCSEDHYFTRALGNYTSSAEGPDYCFDNEDNNCDGEIDDSCPCLDGSNRVCGATDVGSCSYGTETCTNGTWGSCSGARGPAAEICNGEDDNCDGSIDEGLSCGGRSGRWWRWWRWRSLHASQH
ncbi:MAG: hypothetical protein HC945_04385, partial [Nitrosarchaeum sp.]|nr:hypothetical protein [Nitrosarchaeum sp.]